MDNTGLMESVYCTYYNKIKDYLYENLSNESILEDATQEIFEEFFRLLTKEQIIFSTEQDFLIQQILFFLADELCYYYKKSKISAFIKVKQLKTINKTIKKELNERYRDILTLRYIKQYDVDTIIDIMHLKNKDSYKTLIKRAKQQLAKLLIILLLLVTFGTSTLHIL